MKATDHQGSPRSGHPERLATFIKRTLELHASGEPYRQIALRIQKEFGLEKVPAVSTVAHWRSQGFEALSEDIRELQIQWRMDQMGELQEQKFKLLQKLNSEKWSVTRTKMVAGEIVEYVDENTHKERMEMIDRFVKLAAREAKLFGLDLLTPENKEGENFTFRTLQMAIIDGQSLLTPNNPTGQVLELETGLPEFDS